MSICHIGMVKQKRYEHLKSTVLLYSWSNTHALTLMPSNEGTGSFITSVPSHRQAEAVTGWGIVFKG